MLTAAVACTQLMVSTGALALPTDGAVVEGQAEIIYGDASVTIQQGSDRVVIEWRTFDIASHESVNFVQPSQLAAALNRVLSGDPSQILGSLSANGQVFISNPAGVVFGPDAAVDVQSIVATSLDIMNRNFMDNRLDFDIAGDPTAAVENHGSINASGLAALVGPGARNAGTIVADLAIIGGGEAFALDYYGDGLVNFAITHPTTSLPTDADGNPVEALVVNDGTIVADGGQVILTADAAAGVIDTVINLDGVVLARSVESRNGQVALVGGDEGTVALAGRIEAVGDDAGEAGGTVHVLGDTVALGDGAVIDVSGAAGGGTVLVGGDRGGVLSPGGDLAYLAPVVGDRSGTTIVVDASYEADGFIPAADIVYVEAGAVVAADATDTGDGGLAVVWAEEEARFHGNISAKGGANGGDGGFVEVSARDVYVTGQVDTSASQGGFGQFLIDPTEALICDGALASCGDAANEIADSTLAASLALANVTLLTSAVGLGTGDGAWTVETGAEVTWAAATTLTLTANDETGANADQGVISVESAVILNGIDAGSQIVFNAGTVNLLSDISAGTLSGTASTVSVQSDDAQIQDGVDFADTGGTVTVAAGVYDPFTIDVVDLTVTGAGPTTIVNAAGPAVTVAAGGVTVQSLLLQGTGAVDEVGIVLDGVAAPFLVGVTILDVGIANMDDGIRGQGDTIGVVIQGVDISEATGDGIAFGPLDEASVSIVDSSISAGVHGIAFFGSVSGSSVEISSNVIHAGTTQGANGDGIHFAGTISEPSLVVGGSTPEDGNTITVGTAVAGGGTTHDGIYFGGRLVGRDEAALIGNNTINVLALGGSSSISVGDMGIRFDGLVDLEGGQPVGLRIVDNHIDAGQGQEDRGIVFWDGIGGINPVIIRGNTIASGDDGIGVFNLEAFGIGDGAGNAQALRGNARLLIEGNAIGTDVVRAGLANSDDGNGIDLQGVTGASQVRIVGNDVFAQQNAIEFDRTVTTGFAGGPGVEITNNGTLDSLQENGIDFARGVSGASVLIANNNDGIVAALHGIEFGAAVRAGALIRIRGNVIDAGNVRGLNGDGIHFAERIADSVVLIGGGAPDDGNIITVGTAVSGGGTTHDGIYFGGDLVGVGDGADFIRISGNTINVLALGGGTSTSVGDMGIRFDGFIDLRGDPEFPPDLVRIVDNDITAGQGQEDRGIVFWNGIGGSGGVEIASNTVSSGDDGIAVFDLESAGLGDGIGRGRAVRDRAVLRIVDNEIGTPEARVGLANNADGNGIDLQGIVDGSILRIDGNTVFANMNAVEFEQLVSTGRAFRVAPASGIVGNTALDSLRENAIAFEEGATGAWFAVADNGLVAAHHAIEFGAAVLSSRVEIYDNIVEAGLAGGSGGVGILFGGDVGPGGGFYDPWVWIDDNTLMTTGHGIAFNGAVTEAWFEIQNNTVEAGLAGGPDSDGVHFDGAISGSNVSVEANDITVGEAVDGDGTTHDGVYFGGAITGLTRLVIRSNTIDVLNLGGPSAVSAGDMGIRFDGFVDLLDGAIDIPEFGPSGVLIANNDISAAEGQEDRGIVFWNGIGGESRVTIRDNTIAAGDDGIGMFDVEAFGLGDGVGALEGVRGDARVLIQGNAIGTTAVPVGLANDIDGNGVDIQAVAGTAQVRIVENEIFANVDAIQFDQTVTTTFAGPGAGIEITDNPVLNALRGMEINFVGGVSGATTTLIQNNN